MVPVVDHNRMHRVYEHGECDGMSKKYIFGFVIAAIMVFGILKRYKDVQQRKNKSKIYH